jgi:hypothetical protein
VPSGRRCRCAHSRSLRQRGQRTGADDDRRLPAEALRSACSDVDLGARLARNLPQERAFPRVAFHQLETRAARSPSAAQIAQTIPWKTAARSEVEPQTAGFRRKLEKLERIEKCRATRAPRASHCHEVQLGLPFPEQPARRFPAARVFHVKHSRRSGALPRLPSRGFPLIPPDPRQDQRQRRRCHSVDPAGLRQRAGTNARSFPRSSADRPVRSS